MTVLARIRCIRLLKTIQLTTEKSFRACGSVSCLDSFISRYISFLNIFLAFSVSGRFQLSFSVFLTIFAVSYREFFQSTIARIKLHNHQAKFPMTQNFSQKILLNRTTFSIRKHHCYVQSSLFTVQTTPRKRQ